MQILIGNARITSPVPKMQAFTDTVLLVRIFLQPIINRYEKPFIFPVDRYSCDKRSYFL